MMEDWIIKVPVLSHFSQVADPSHYLPLPDDWHIGVTDVVDSTGAAQAGRYKSVNLAGAATIGAVANALDGDLPLFAFGGDGARFAVSQKQSTAAFEALSQVAKWAKRDLDLEMRAGITTVATIRAAGFDVRVAFWQASDNVRYAMFTGGGLEWAEKQLKKGNIECPKAATDNSPDLTGVSCQWGEIVPKHGKILSLIIKQASGASQADFSRITTEVFSILQNAECLNPVSSEGPDVHWSTASIVLQARLAHKGLGKALRLLRVILITMFTWIVFKLETRIGRFDPKRYRREIAQNSDFRKFHDGLMMTVDCSQEIAGKIRALLDKATDEGVILYGMHIQDVALMTCLVPSVLASDHVHFVDGAGGGYAAAAKKLKEPRS